MDLFIYIACIAACLAAASFAALRSMHMFQLNSYKASTHGKWLRGNFSKLWSQVLLLLFMVIYFFVHHIAMQVIFIALCVVFCLSNRPLKNAKKPLVYTARVKRMLVTAAVLLVGISLLSFLLAEPFRFELLCLLYLLAPVLPIIANTINAPVESSARRYYINDAKKILKSCPNLLIIGITGSYGKTSVKYYLTTLLRAKYNVLMTPESYNTPMGVVKTIREQLRSTHEIFVCEMGARHKGDIKELCDIVNPQHGIITSIGEQHLETFKTVETIIKTKFELADAVSGKGVIFLNGDNMLIRDHLPNQEFRTYGLSEQNDSYAYDIKVTQNGTTFSLNDRGERVEGLQTQLIGEHNVINLVGAMALCSSLGVPYDGMRTQLKKITSPPHRLQLTKNNGMIIIDDAYNSNPSGCRAALQTLSLFDGCKILITPGMVELGAKQDECNRAFGAQAAEVCDFVILVGEKQTKPIFEGLSDAKYDPSKIFVADKFSDAINKAYSITNERQKVILLENDLPDNY